MVKLRYYSVKAENGCIEWEVLRVNYTISLGGSAAAARLIVMLWSLMYSTAAAETAAGAPERWVTIILLRGPPGRRALALC